MSGARSAFNRVWPLGSDSNVPGHTSWVESWVCSEPPAEPASTVTFAVDAPSTRPGSTPTAVTTATRPKITPRATTVDLLLISPRAGIWDVVVLNGPRAGRVTAELVCLLSIHGAESETARQTIRQREGWSSTRVPAVRTRLVAPQRRQSGEKDRGRIHLGRPDNHIVEVGDPERVVPELEPLVRGGRGKVAADRPRGLGDAVHPDLPAPRGRSGEAQLHGDPGPHGRDPARGDAAALAGSVEDVVVERLAARVVIEDPANRAARVVAAIGHRG